MTREEETSKWSGLDDTGGRGSPCDTVDVLMGGDAANSNEMLGLVSVVSQHGSCSYCYLGRCDWINWKKVDKAALRSDFKDTILKHENPDLVHGRDVVPHPAGRKRQYVCTGKGCSFELSAENIEREKAEYEAMSEPKRRKKMRAHARTHGGNLPHKLAIIRADANT